MSRLSFAVCSAVCLAPFSASCSFISRSPFLSRASCSWPYRRATCVSRAFSVSDLLTGMPLIRSASSSSFTWRTNSEWSKTANFWFAVMAESFNSSATLTFEFILRSKSAIMLDHRSFAASPALRLLIWLLSARFSTLTTSLSCSTFPNFVAFSSSTKSSSTLNSRFTFSSSHLRTWFSSSTFLTRSASPKSNDSGASDVPLK
mmetsp:Transcript_31640/g.72689  ORF Transcript_31640/g.72689 Transcript_31640/m.72689 type:complete len:203 (+) Transcript_31640:670-1278(+)